MIVGHVRDSLPRVTLDLPGTSGPLRVEFILDAGFEGDLTLPARVLQQLQTQPLFLSLRSRADGTVRECPLHQLVLDWADEPRTVEVLALEHNPLLGTTLLQGCRVDLEFIEGAEVLIEFAA